MRQVPLCTVPPPPPPRNKRACEWAMMLNPTWLQQPKVCCSRFSLPDLVLQKAEPANHDQNLWKRTVLGLPFSTLELPSCKPRKFLNSSTHATLKMQATWLSKNELFGFSIGTKAAPYEPISVGDSWQSFQNNSLRCLGFFRRHLLHRSRWI